MSPTQKEIAQQSGVSRSTVREVISGNPRVAAATRAKVLGVMERLNYRPNGAARELVSRRSEGSSVGVGRTSLDLCWTPLNDPIREAVFAETVEEFKRQNSDIGIRLTYTNYSHLEFLDRLLLALSSSGTPSCAYLDHPHFHKFARLGLCADISSYVSAWPGRAGIVREAWEVVTRGGRIFGFPTSTASIQVLHYNLRLFSEHGLDPDRLPQTWPEVVECALALTDRRKDRYGIDLGPAWALPYFFIDLLYQFGGRLFRPDNGNYRLAIDEEPGLEALRFLRDLRWKHKVISPNVVRNEEDCARDFATGKCGILAFSLFTHELQRLGQPRAEIGLAPLPTVPGGRAFCQLGIGAWVINSQAAPAQQRAAWEWVRFINGPEALSIRWQAYHRQGNTPPLVLTLDPYSESAEMMASLPAQWQATLAAARQSARTVTYPSGYEIDTLREMLLRILSNPEAKIEDEVADCLRNYRCVAEFGESSQETPGRGALRPAST